MEPVRPVLMVDLVSLVEVALALEALNLIAWVLAYRKSRRGFDTLAEWTKRIFGVDVRLPPPPDPTVPVGALVPSPSALVAGTETKTFTRKDGTVVTMRKNADGKWVFAKAAAGSGRPVAPPEAVAKARQLGYSMDQIRALAAQHGYAVEDESSEAEESSGAPAPAPNAGGIGGALMGLAQAGKLNRENALPVLAQLFSRQAQAPGAGRPALDDGSDWQ